MEQQAKRKSRFWRRCRIVFRRFRIAVWCLVLLLLGGLIYLNLIGVPDFVKRPLLARLQERGIDLQFRDLKLHWSRGFIAEQVHFGASGTATNPAAPQFSAQEVEFNFRLRALLTGKVQVDSLAMRGGKLEWVLDAAGPLRPLTIDEIETRLRFLPEDRWMLDDLRGGFAGAHFFFTGSLTNASALRDWQRGKTAHPFDAQRWSRRLQQLAEVLAQISFSAPPELRLDVNGDARNLKTFDARLTLRANDADTSWGRAENVLLRAQMFPASSNELARAELSLQAQQTKTRWANTDRLDLKLRLVTPADRPDQVEAAATVRANRTETPWATLTEASVKAAWTHSFTNPIPSRGELEIHADSGSTWLTRAGNLNLSARWESIAAPLPADAALGFWTNLLPYQISWTASVAPLNSLALQANHLEGAGTWHAPLLTITKLTGAMYEGRCNANGTLDVITRQLAGTVTSDFEIKRFAPLLPSKAQQWLDRFTWSQPPNLTCTADLRLPSWTNPAPNWAAEVRPTLELAGHVALTNGSYQAVHADWATTHFTYTNFTWGIPDLVVKRPEGNLIIQHRANDLSREYYFNLHSTIDPRAVLPLLEEDVRRGFDLCEFSQPPIVAGEVWGRWYDRDSVGFRGTVVLTNFSFRNQLVDAAVSGLEYTNLVITCLQPRIWSGTQHISADGITADFNKQRTYFTNGFSTFAPSTVVHMIGPMVTKVMEPYHFGAPPVARFNGFAPMDNPQDVDLTFEGSGNGFESLGFRAQQYEARVIWRDNRLTVTNVAGEFYGGTAGGWANFVFADEHHAQFAFFVDVTNALLSPLVADVTGKPNQLEGRLNGRLNVTNAWTDNIYSWNGDGHATLTNGLVWELPVFGVLSGPLDSIMPGVGNSRFTEASGTYGILDSTVFSKDLEMRSSTMRLQYRGAVDFDGNLNARVFAEPLRDTPVVGPVVSSILAPVARLFAYRITGTLADPKSEPINIPAPMMYLFSPFQSLGELFAPGTPTSSTPPFDPDLAPRKTPR